jgi:FAD:protein FMN transferase
MQLRTKTVLLSVLFSFAVPTGRTSEPVAFSGRAMGTNWTVKIDQPAPSLDSAQLVRQISERLEQLEQIFSTYRPHSELSRFNAVTHTEWVPVSAEMAEVARLSHEVSGLTAGAYDVTVFPLVRLWGFAAQRRTDVLPAPAEVATARGLVDWRKLELRPEQRALRKSLPQLTADFSSMAKGFAADALSELLAQREAGNHFVQVGGDIRTRGAPHNAAGWNVGIEQPIEGRSDVACVVTLNGQALSTSGDYRNYFQAGQRRYGHIIDPRTGEPVSSLLAAVSVVEARSARSSALATGLFVLGPDEGFRLATEHRLACLFFVRHGTEVVQKATPAFERFRKARSSPR